MLQGLDSLSRSPLDRAKSEDYEGYWKESRIRSVLVSFGSLPRGKVFVVLFVVDAEDAAAAGGLPGCLARPRERYNDGIRDLKQGLAIRRLVGFVNIGGASRFW